MKPFLLRLVACLFLSVSLNSFGALHVRDLDGDWSNGHEGVYDDVLDITWLADANLSASLPLGTEGYLQGENYADTWIINFASHNGSGYYGFNGWRLPAYHNPDYPGHDHHNPTASWTFNGSTPISYNYYNTDSELGYMFYVNFGNIGAVDAAGNLQNSTPHAEIYDSAEGLFNPSGEAQYWTGTDLSSGSRRLAFYFDGGYQAAIGPTSSAGIWPVHDGDIGLAPVPLPAGIWLFGSALAGLLVARRKHKK
ncbi:VPLPA-CTERM sorting domain-containing protein [Pseudomonadales bacterium]|nr:VPLPA-CTERM sorting domain-containing protein [Pseudomonadales bacterium]